MAVRKVTMKNFSQRGLLQLGMVTPRRKMSGQVNTHLALSPLASAGGWDGASREERDAHAGVTRLSVYPSVYFFKSNKRMLPK